MLIGGTWPFKEPNEVQCGWGSEQNEAAGGAESLTWQRRRDGWVLTRWLAARGWRQASRSGRCLLGGGAVRSQQMVTSLFFRGHQLTPLLHQSATPPLGVGRCRPDTGCFHTETGESVWVAVDTPPCLREPGRSPQLPAASPGGLALGLASAACVIPGVVRLGPADLADSEGKGGAGF